MKKFTLFAAAALAATPVFAATPEQAQKMPVAKQTMTLNAQRAALRSDLSRSLELNAPAALGSRAEGDATTAAPSVLYVPTANSFYSGWTPATDYYKTTMGFTGIRNSVGFRNLTSGTDVFSWSYGRVTGLTEDKQDYTYDYTTSTDQHLFMALNPMQRYSWPVLSAGFGEEEINYGNETGNQLYYCGHSTLDWGWTTAEEGATEITWSNILGVSPCYNNDGASLFPEFMVCRPGGSQYDAKYFTAEGTSANWYAYSEEGSTLENMVIKGFASYIPAMPSPYQMDAMWFWCQTEAKAAMTLPVNVYFVNQDGSIDFTAPVASGELNIAEGKTTLQSTGEMPVIEIQAVDEDGYAIDSPLCVPAGVAVFAQIEGLDNPDLLEFDLIANDATTFSESTQRQISSYMWPSHAYANIECDITEGGETVKDNLLLTAPYGYYADKANDPDKLIRLSDFSWFFNIYFPVVMNADKSSADYQSANFNAEIPAEGGETVVPVMADFKIDVLLSEGLATADATEWITFNQVYDEETGVTNVTISAAALPEGTPGRTGYVVYQGYGLDFYITVTQGEVAGIDSIVVKPAAKGTRYYDLQGRRLQAAPANGMYIETVNGVSTKHIAR